MSKAALVVLVVLGVLSFHSAPGAEAGFSAKPTATKDGDKVKIAFAVSAPTDVEVAVLDAQGKVVRHLAAGVLGGKNPPPEPLKPGLAQELAWDGKDDAGKPAVGGPFKARVRAGMSVKFGRIIGSSPYTGDLWGADGLAVAPDGTLYVKLASTVGVLHNGLPWQVRQFDRTGKYRKTILPLPPSVDPAKAAGFGLIDAGNGLLTPRHGSGLEPFINYVGNNIHNQVVDGQLVFFDHWGARLVFLRLDGSHGLRVVPMRSSPDKFKWLNCPASQIAFSPDGKRAYYSNVAKLEPDKPDPKFPHGWVYRQDLDKPGSDPERFYSLDPSDPAKAGAWAGLAVDAKGHVFVCDRVNQEVVEVSPEGKKLSSTKVPWPDKVLASPKSGTLYVVSRKDSDSWPLPGELLKVTGRGAEAKVVARLPLTGRIGQSVALDESGEVPALWLGGGDREGNTGKDQVIRVEDRGAELAVARENILNTDKNAITFACYGGVDVEAELVYVAQNNGPVWRYSGETGEGGLTPIRAVEVAIGPGGIIYTFGNSDYYLGPVARYTRDFKPAPLPSTGKHTYGHVGCRSGRGHNPAGFAVDWQGRVYATQGFVDCDVIVYDADGKLVEYERKGKGTDSAQIKGGRPALISYVKDMGGVLRLDPAGNLYVLAAGLPKGFVPPKGFEKDPAYLNCMGLIYKFTPKGGEFKFTREWRTNGWNPEGVVAVYSTPSGPLSGDWACTMASCNCNRTRFDVDAFGRLYIPNGITYKVAIVDNADNHILTFGGYGNWDAQGPKSAEPKPEIPLGCPMFAGASDRYIYVGDMLNHRVVRVDKVFAAESICELK